jgi:L-alanine-DL-glutamate epimerase-like enolase superfamily enzyme
MSERTTEPSAVLHRVSMPMHRAFGHAKKVRKQAEGVILHLHAFGIDGYGECAPRPYVTGETPETVVAAISTFDLDNALSAIDVGSFEEALFAIEKLSLPDQLASPQHPGLSAACCVELALIDLIARRFDVPIERTAEILGLDPAIHAGRGKGHRFTRALDSSKTPDDIKKTPQDFHVLKIKVGLGREEDIERVGRARELFGADFTLTADANMAWSLDQACEMFEALAPFDIAWFEEPLRKGALDDYRELRRRTETRIMLDESLCSYEDAQRAIASEACDLFNIRLSKHGGFLAGLRFAELAHKHGIQYQLGTHPGSQGILRAAEWKFVHTIGNFVAVEAARSNAWVEEELVEETLRFEGNRATPLEGPGWGITVIPERLEKATAQQVRWEQAAKWC